MRLKYLYSSHKEEIVPRNPTVPIESFCDHKIPGGAQLIAMVRSAVNPITEIISCLCKYLICLCPVTAELSDSSLSRRILPSSEWLLKTTTRTTVFHNVWKSWKYPYFPKKSLWQNKIYCKNIMKIFLLT